MRKKIISIISFFCICCVISCSPIDVGKDMIEETRSDRYWIKKSQELVELIKKEDWEKAEKMICERTRFGNYPILRYGDPIQGGKGVKIMVNGWSMPILIWTMYRHKPPLSFVEKAVLAINHNSHNLDCYCDPKRLKKPKPSECYAFAIKDDVRRITILSLAVSHGQTDVVKWLLSDQNPRKKELLLAEKGFNCPAVHAVLNLGKNDEDLAIFMLKKFYFTEKKLCQDHIGRDSLDIFNKSLDYGLNDFEKHLLERARKNDWLRVTQMVFGNHQKIQAKDKKEAILKLVVERNPQNFAEEELYNTRPCGRSTDYKVLPGGKLKKIVKVYSCLDENYYLPRAKVLLEYDLKSQKPILKNFNQFKSAISHMQWVQEYCKKCSPLNVKKLYLDMLNKIFIHDLERARISPIQATKLLAEVSPYDNLEITQLLLKKGANLNIPINKDDTVLTYVIRKNASTKMIAYFLEEGANPNLATIYSKRTPLFYAIQKGRIDVVKLLLKYKANPNVKDYVGMTPLLYSMLYQKTKNQKKWQQITKLLSEYGAKNPYPYGYSPIDAAITFAKTAKKYAFIIETYRCYGFPKHQFENISNSLKRQRDIQCGNYSFSYLNEQDISHNPNNFLLKGIFSQYLNKKIVSIRQKGDKRYGMENKVDMTTAFVSWLIEVTKCYDPGFFEKGWKFEDENLPRRIYELMITGHTLSEMIVRHDSKTFNKLATSFALTLTD